MNAGWYRKHGKRAVDLLVSLTSLVVFLPVLGICAVAIRMDSSGPIIFTQKRLGLHGRVFNAYKFRTMTDKPRTVRQVHRADDEVTRTGAILRRTKLDELPQLVNVVLGDMSIVGPRPCMPELRAEFNADGEARLSVRPGLTGLAQVSGNIYLTWPERWKLDREYASTMSFALDARIILKTVLVVLHGEEKFRA